MIIPDKLVVPAELPSGEWKGFYLEKHQPNRGWMHLYLLFEPGTLKGEGTDYVGPWHIQGNFDAQGNIEWVKQYLGKHRVRYHGAYNEQGIRGEWLIHGVLAGPFHIWPKSLREMDERYLRNELNVR